MAVGAWESLARSCDAMGVSAADEAALRIHAVLFPRDNVTDVRGRVRDLAEQASYIWFTCELESGGGSEWGGGEAPLKDPDVLLPPRSHKPRRKQIENRHAAPQQILRVVSAPEAGVVSKQARARERD
eukprot:6206299-Pleurochrysis_carterae.AAC.1